MKMKLLTVLLLVAVFVNTEGENYNKNIYKLNYYILIKKMNEDSYGALTYIHTTLWETLQTHNN